MLYLPNLPMRSCPTSLISLYSWSLSMCCWSSSSLYLWTWFSRKVRVNLDLQSIGWQSPTSTPTPPPLKFSNSGYHWLTLDWVLRFPCLEFLALLLNCEFRLIRLVFPQLAYFAVLIEAEKLKIQTKLRFGFCSSVLLHGNFGVLKSQYVKP